jgi:hypothetical protein
MKTRRKSKANRWIVGLAVLSLLICFGMAFAGTNICQKHTGNGWLSENFTPDLFEDLTLDAKAPASGDLWVYIDIGHHYIAQIWVSDSDREAVHIAYDDMETQNEFGSRVTNWSSGNGYANLITKGYTSNCIPSGTPD